MESAGKRLRTRTDIGKDIERCLDDLKITHAELAEMLNVSDKTVDRMIGGKGPTTKYEKRTILHHPVLYLKMEKIFRWEILSGQYPTCRFWHRS